MAFKIPAIYLEVDVALIIAVTNVHCGAGRFGGIVDLPIQRDEYEYPCIYSSSIKGALKTALLYAFAKEYNGDYEKARKAVMTLLGPEPESGETFESSIAILDAYLLTMPVRSLRGIYAYVTSPLLLKRFVERVELVTEFSNKHQGASERQASLESKVVMLRDRMKKLLEQAEDLKEDECICVGDCSGLRIEKLEGEPIILIEEVLVKPKSEDKDRNILNVLGLDRPLLVLHDETARYVIDRGIIRLTRVRLRKDTKTVEAGPWTEEYLPTKARLHTLILYKRPPLSESYVRSILNKKEGEISAEDYVESLNKLGLLKDKNEIMKLIHSGDYIKANEEIVKELRKAFKEIIEQHLRNYLIVGGHETIGKGAVKLMLLG